MENLTRGWRCIPTIGGPPLFVIAMLLGIMALTAVPAHAQLSGLNTTTGFLRAKAAPDDCWLGLGANLPFQMPACSGGATPKVNQGYVWAMTEAGDKIFFGTLSNGQCVTAGGLVSTPTPYATDSWACEFGDSVYSKPPISLLPGNLGDFRPPKMYVYSKTSQTTTEITHYVTPTITNPLGFDPFVQSTLGIRAATTIGNLVLMAGPTLNALGGLTFFAYDATTSGLLGEYFQPCTVIGPNTICYTNIRQFVTYQGQTYTAVGKMVNGHVIGGAILKWTGTAPGGPFCTASCFSFTEIGTIPDGQGAYIAAHGGRLYVSTWPTGIPGSVASLYMSPTVPLSGGLTGDPAWTKVWSVASYDPDPVNQAGYSGGAVADFDGYLYWGTMHIPFGASGIWFLVYGAPATQQALEDVISNTFQTTTIFRGANFDTTPSVDLLYGSPVLPLYSPGTQTWSIVPNNMPAGHKDPLYGAPGFGNPFNNYLWSMKVWNNQLWMGTMDWSYMAEDEASAIVDPSAPPATILPGGDFQLGPVNFFNVFNITPGADLMFIQDPTTPAIPESLTGVGNFTSYGVRNMLASTTADDSLFLGMANPMNLLTAASLGNHTGGWELIELNANPSATPVNALTGFGCAPSPLTGGGTVNCTVTLASPAGSFGALVSLAPFPVAIPGSPKLTLPPGILVPPFSNSTTFPVAIPEVSAPTEAAMEASFNGGTRVASVQLTTGLPRISGTTGALSLANSSPKVIAVAVNLTNTGTGIGNLLSVSSVVLKTLAGTGTVTYIGTTYPGSPTLPLSLGTLDVGNTNTPVLYFNVPATVSRFAITESGTVQSLAGTSYTWSTGQTVFTSQAH